MTLETGGCNGVREVSGAEFEGKSVPEVVAQEDVKRSGECNGIACGEAEDVDGIAKDDVDGSYVFVNGKPDELTERDLDVVGKADLAGSQRDEPSVEFDYFSEKDLGGDSKDETRIPDTEGGVAEISDLTPTADAELEGRTSDCKESSDLNEEKGDLVSSVEEQNREEEGKGGLILGNSHDRKETSALVSVLDVGTPNIQEETSIGDVVEGHSAGPDTEMENEVSAEEQGCEGSFVNGKVEDQEVGESLTATPFETKDEDSESVVTGTAGSPSLSLVNGTETMSFNAEEGIPAEEPSEIVVSVTHESESVPLGDEETLGSNGTEGNPAAEQVKLLVAEGSGSESWPLVGEDTLASNCIEGNPAAEQSKVVATEGSRLELLPLEGEETLTSNDREDNLAAEQAKIVVTERSVSESLPSGNEETLASNGTEDNPAVEQAKMVVAERSGSESLPLTNEEEPVILNSAGEIPAVEQFAQPKMEPESETQSGMELGDKSHENSETMPIPTVDEKKTWADESNATEESSERMPSCPVMQPEAEGEATEVLVESLESSNRCPVDDGGSVKEVMSFGDNAKNGLEVGKESAESRECVLGHSANDMDSRIINEEITMEDKSENGMASETEATINSLKNQDCVSASPEVETRLEECEETTSAILRDDTTPVTEVESGENVSAILGNDAAPTTKEGSEENASAIPDNDTTPVSEDSHLTVGADKDVLKTESVIGVEPVERRESMTDSREEIQSASMDDPNRHASAEDNVAERSHENEALVAPIDDPGSLSLPGQKMDTDVKHLPFFMVRVPRFSDDKLKMQIQQAQQEVDEKTGSRDSIRVAMQNQKGICAEYWRKFDDARKEERAARDAVASKRQEIDSIQSILSKVKNATSISDIDNRIHKLQQRINHETNTLKEEKSLIREMNQLKQSREHLSSSLASEQELREAFEKQEQMETHLKHLKEELDTLRKDTLQAEGNIKDAKTRYDNQLEHLRDLQTQFKAADDLRQEAYTELRNLKKESFVKNQYFYSYKDNMNVAANYAFSGDRGALRSHCTNQVEKIMELWNKNDEFRHQYVKANIPSTLRRFRTLDGRSLGPNEEPAIIHNLTERKENIISLPVSKNNTPVLATERKQEKADAPLSTAKINLTDGATPAQKSQLQKPKKVTQPATNEVVSNRESDKEETEKEQKQTIEEEEQARKAAELARKEEELRKEKEAAKMKEQLRLEQIAKAKEAEERKKRKAEKVQAKAEMRAQKEAELKEKKKEKKGRKKEKKSTATTTENDAEAEEPASPAEIPQESVQEQPEKTSSGPSRRPSRPRAVAAAKEYNRVKPLPPPLRNRGKRRMQTWMWVVLTVLAVLTLFMAGNYVSFSKFGLRNFSF